jgi:hypothetical protein
MAWIDDRIWCHPKFTDVSPRGCWTWVKGVAYSTGFATRGVLTSGQQTAIGSTPKIRQELVAAGLWEQAVDNAILIHDWADHNSKRDDRRAADRARKRAARAADKSGHSGGTSNGASAGPSAGASSGTSTVSARVDGSEGSEGSDKNPVTPTEAVSAARHSDPGHGFGEIDPDEINRVLAQAAATDAER